MQTNFINYKGTTLAYIEMNSHKSNPPIIMMHGIMLSVNYWPILLQQMLPDYHWISLSLPGHYPSRLSPDIKRKDLDEKYFADLLNAAREQLNIRQPVIIGGHSTGGFAALNFAARYPKYVHGVMSVAGFAQGHWHGIEGLQQQLTHGGWIGERLFDISYKMGILNKTTYNVSSSIYAGDKKAYFANKLLSRLIDVTYEDIKNHDLRQLKMIFHRTRTYDIRSLLHNIAAPTLILAGDKDTVIPFEDSTYLANHIPHAKLEVFKGKGHMMFVESEKHFMETVKKWVIELL